MEPGWYYLIESPYVLSQGLDTWYEPDTGTLPNFDLHIESLEQEEDVLSVKRKWVSEEELGTLYIWS